MKSPEEEANRELGKRLREKFEDYKVPGEDRTRNPIFAALDKSTNKLYWIYLIVGLLLICAFSLFYFGKTSSNFPNKEFSFSSIKSTSEKPIILDKPNYKLETGVNGERRLRQHDVISVSKNIIDESKNLQTDPKRSTAVHHHENSSSKSMTIVDTALVVSSKQNRNVSLESNAPDQRNVNIQYDLAITSNEECDELAFLRPIDSLNFSLSLDSLLIRPVSSSNIKEVIKRRPVTYGIKGVFYGSIMQTFQLVNLSSSADDRVQNLKFASLLSSKSLSYKLMAGIEKEHTQLIFNYTYLRSWNEYEIGTDKVIATKVGENQYHMSIIGDKYLEDERFYLLGIGIRQRLVIPKHILPNYSINLGLDFTRLIGRGQNLVWGNIGFYKNVYKSEGARVDLGPYFQYSFTEHQSTGQMWRSRPYQVGVSLGVKLK